MSKKFIPEITYMKGLCMLGVIAIHVGSYALINPLANPQIIAFFEILSRFSIPTFFFLSAFGLFYHSPLGQPFSYGNFMKRRFSVVLIPYIAWSFLYLLYNSALGHSLIAFHPKNLILTLFFGTASYQLYFLVIILWFYILMPLWRIMVRFILEKPVFWLVLLFLIQTLFNMYSSYYLGSVHLENDALQYLLSMRLNYWVLHYVWIFLLGGVFAEKYDAICLSIRNWSGYIVVAFLFGTMLMLGSYYYVISVWHYSLLSAVYTIHQLSPAGMIYTPVCIIFFLYAFQITPLSYSVKAIFTGLGKASYGMYLVHPFLLYWVTPLIGKMGLLYTAPVDIVLYIVIVFLSYFVTSSIQDLPEKARKILLGS